MEWKCWREETQRSADEHVMSLGFLCLLHFCLFFLQGRPGRKGYIGEPGLDGLVVSLWSFDHCKVNIQNCTEELIFLVQSDWCSVHYCINFQDYPLMFNVVFCFSFLLLIRTDCHFIIRPHTTLACFKIVLWWVKSLLWQITSVRFSIKKSLSKSSFLYFSSSKVRERVKIIIYFSCKSNRDPPPPHGS